MRRGQLEIIISVIEALDNPARPSWWQPCKGVRATWIQYRSNVGYSTLKRILAQLKKGNLVEELDDGTYTLTEKGMEILNHWRAIKKTICDVRDRIYLSQKQAVP